MRICNNYHSVGKDALPRGIFSIPTTTTAILMYKVTAGTILLATTRTTSRNSINSQHHGKTYFMFNLCVPGDCFTSLQFLYTRCTMIMKNVIYSILCRILKVQVLTLKWFDTVFVVDSPPMESVSSNSSDLCCNYFDCQMRKHMRQWEKGNNYIFVCGGGFQPRRVLK